MTSLDDLARYGLVPLGEGPLHGRQPAPPREFDLFCAVQEIAAPATVVELGAWEGASALGWAGVLSEGGVLVCIDTWLGSVEHRRNGVGGEWGMDRLAFDDGFPTLYRTFTDTIRLAGMQDRVIPLPLDSHQGLLLLQELQVRPDVIYIDAAHDRDSVRADLEASIDLVRPDGIVCGDDYWPGSMIKEVVDFHATGRWRILTRDSQFLLLNFRQRTEIDALLDRGWVDGNV